MTIEATAARGWHGDPGTPEFVRQRLDTDARQQRPRPAVLGYRIHRAGGRVEENFTGLGTATPPTLLDEVGYLLAELRGPEVERAEVLFWNVDGDRGPDGRPSGPAAREPGGSYSGDTLTAVASFVNAVADSLHPPEAGKSSGQWAVLELVPVPG